MKSPLKLLMILMVSLLVIPVGVLADEMAPATSGSEQGSEQIGPATSAPEQGREEIGPATSAPEQGTEEMAPAAPGKEQGSEEPGPAGSVPQTEEESGTRSY